MSAEHDATNIVVQNLAYIVTGILTMFLLILRHLGKQKTADIALDVIKEKRVTHDYVDARLAKCQLEMINNINNNLDGFRKELMTEIKSLHTRIDNK
jgi:hypothetical protein